MIFVSKIYKELVSQEEKLKNVNKLLDTIDKHLDESQKDIKAMKSDFDRVTNFFGRIRNKFKDDSSKTKDNEEEEKGDDDETKKLNINSVPQEESKLSTLSNQEIPIQLDEDVLPITEFPTISGTEKEKGINELNYSFICLKTI